MFIDIICPNCGFKNQINIKYTQLKIKEIITCDSEIGGCDKDFLVSIKFNLTTEVETQKIAI